MWWRLVKQDLFFQHCAYRTDLCGESIEYRFVLKIHMGIFMCTFIIFLFVSTNLVQGVRVEQQVEVKAKHCSVAARVSVN